MEHSMNNKDSATALVRYTAACKAVAQCKTVDEAKHLRDKAEAMRAYAHQAKNRDLEIDAAEIRMRAERRLGELIAAQKATVGLADGGDAQRTRFRKGTESRPTLADAGIDKKLSSRAQRLAARPAEQFETMVGKWRVRAHVAGERITTDLLKAQEIRQNRQRYAPRSKWPACWGSGSRRSTATGKGCRFRAPGLCSGLSTSPGAKLPPTISSECPDPAKEPSHDRPPLYHSSNHGGRRALGG
jgi:hypothetical protein